MTNQQTLSSETRFSGIGLHTGNKTTAVFKPAPPGSGIRFVRTDLPGRPEIAARIQNVQDITRGTTLGNGEARVHTVEHLLAALSGLGIDNLVVELDANEPPVGDGSALPFVEVLEKAGVKDQGVPREEVRVTRPLRYTRGEVEMMIVPADDFRINCVIQYDHPILKTQFRSLTITPEVFKREVAPARTFCFDYEVEHLRKSGLAKGGSLDNAVVIGDTGIRNTQLRFPDEPVRHKILDLIGDLALLGRPLLAEVLVFRPGHANNIGFTRDIQKAFGSGSAPGAAVAAADRVGAAAPGPTPAPSDHLGIPAGKVLNIEEIKACIPHRFPFLFLDRVVIVEEQKRVVGFKNMSGNESFFQGHFPDHPITPGVILVEAMAQTSCVLFLSRPELSNKLAYFMGIHEVKFRRPVLPGDTVRMEVEVLRWREHGGKVRGEAYVEGHLAAEAEFSFALVDKGRSS